MDINRDLGADKDPSRFHLRESERRTDIWTFLDGHEEPVQQSGSNAAVQSLRGTSNIVFRFCDHPQPLVVVHHPVAVHHLFLSLSYSFSPFSSLSSPHACILPFFGDLTMYDIFSSDPFFGFSFLYFLADHLTDSSSRYS